MSPAREASARFPFSAVVGHDDLRLALLLNAVHPGSAGCWSAARRAPRSPPWCGRSRPCCPADGGTELPFRLRPGRNRTRAARTARMRRDAESARRPARLVELPVGATEDRLVGSLDLERVLPRA